VSRTAQSVIWSTLVDFAFKLKNPVCARKIAQQQCKLIAIIASSFNCGDSISDQIKVSGKFPGKTGAILAFAGVNTDDVYYNARSFMYV